MRGHTSHRKLYFASAQAHLFYKFAWKEHNAKIRLIVSTTFSIMFILTCKRPGIVEPSQQYCKPNQKRECIHIVAASSLLRGQLEVAVCWLPSPLSRRPRGGGSWSRRRRSSSACQSGGNSSSGNFRCRSPSFALDQTPDNWWHTKSPKIKLGSKWTSSSVLTENWNVSC